MQCRFDQVFQFKVVLKDIAPPIWRRIQVPSTYRFWDLHVAIQDAMGWHDAHLHAFRILNPATGMRETIGVPDENFPDVFPTLSGWDVQIARYFSRDNASADYSTISAIVGSMTSSWRPFSLASSRLVIRDVSMGDGHALPRIAGEPGDTKIS